MSDTTVASPPPWKAGRRPRPTWGLAEGDELAPGRTVLRRIGGGHRYEAMLVWDEHRLAVLVAKVLRPDQAREPIEQLLPLGLHVASALHYMAAEGIVHLDVKPSNIVMGGPPRLIDLSVARP